MLHEFTASLSACVRYNMNTFNKIFLGPVAPSQNPIWSLMFLQLHFNVHLLLRVHSYLNSSMEQSPSCDAKSRSAGTEISHVLWNPKVH